MTDREQEIDKMVEIAYEYSKDIANTPYYKGTRTDMEAIYDAGYRKADDLLVEIAGLTGKCDALQKDNDNLMRTLDEGTEVVEEAKRKTAEEIFKEIRKHYPPREKITSPDDAYMLMKFSEIAEKYGVEIKE